LGLQVLAMALVVGVGQGMIEHYAKALGTTDIRIQDQAVLLVVAIMLLVMVNKVPPLVGSLANGSIAGAAGSGFGAGEALSAASTALAGAALAKTALSAAAGSATGGVMGAFSAGSAPRGSVSDAASLWGDFEGHEGRTASDAAPPDEQEHDDASSSALTDEQEHGDRNDDKASQAQAHATEPEAEQRDDGTGKQHSPSSTRVPKSPQRFTGDRSGAQSSGARGKASRAAGAMDPDQLLAEFDSSKPGSADHRMQASKPSGRTPADLDRGGSVQAPLDSAPARDATNASPPAQAAGQSQHAMGPASAAASAPAVSPAERTTAAAPVVAGGALASASPMVSSAAQYSAALPAQPPPPAGALAVAPTVWSLSAAGSPPATPGSSSPSVAGGAHALQQSSGRDFGGLIAGFAEGGAAPATALVATQPNAPQLAPPSTAAAPTNEFSMNVEDEVAAFRERG
ncbi:MAG TPA: hypothetical protein VK524_09175, partial [Polyangiaceae bacterium]|nr:hypothetical protein [Polyangiaceae bacterium]